MWQVSQLTDKRYSSSNTVVSNFCCLRTPNIDKKKKKKLKLWKGQPSLCCAPSLELHGLLVGCWVGTFLLLCIAACWELTYWGTLLPPLCTALLQCMASYCKTQGSECNANAVVFKHSKQHSIKSKLNSTIYHLCFTTQTKIPWSFTKPWVPIETTWRRWRQQLVLRSVNNNSDLHVSPNNYWNFYFVKNFMVHFNKTWLTLELCQAASGWWEPLCADCNFMRTHIKDLQ